MRLDKKRLMKLARARCSSFCEENTKLPQIQAKHLVSRYFECLCEGYPTEQIEYLLEKSVFTTYSASKDFTIYNMAGYFIKVFDSHIGNIPPEINRLETKLKTARNDWNASKKAVEEMVKGWDFPDKEI